MSLITLSKEETKELENNSVRIDNFVHKPEKLFKLHFLLTTWYATQGLSANETEKTYINYLTEKFDCSPLYYRVYEYRNAVWGFKWKAEKHSENNKIIIYRDKRGLSIQIHPKFRKDMIEDFLKDMVKILVNLDNLKDYQIEYFKDILDEFKKV